jgi:glycosyltransferase involved in cell wall biosynthesis
VAHLEPIDVLLASPGTTPGWRRADGELVQALRDLGLRVEVCTSDFRIARHFRRTMLLTDLAEAAAMRTALRRALRRWRPSAVVISTPQAAMLQPLPRLGGATAVRFDAPAALNRRGFGSGLLHALERRALGAVRLLLPWGLEAPDGARASLRVDTAMVPLPIPVEGAGVVASHDRGAFALAYAGNPDKKGLDLMARAWQIAGPAGWRLVVTGIDAEAGRRFLRRRSIAEPPGIEWAGVVPPDRYSDLIRHAELFLAASRYEDFGLAQLEALAHGDLLVTVPSPGPYEALALARELEPRLVADEVSAEALAEALSAAVALSAGQKMTYRDRARELVAPYARETLRKRLKDEVLPALLGGL